VWEAREESQKTSQKKPRKGNHFTLYISGAVRRREFRKDGRLIFEEMHRHQQETGQPKEKTAILWRRK
jgi:hypothetical protein